MGGFGNRAGGTICNDRKVVAPAAGGRGAL